MVSINGANAEGRATILRLQQAYYQRECDAVMFGVLAAGWQIVENHRGNYYPKAPPNQLYNGFLPEFTSRNQCAWWIRRTLLEGNSQLIGAE